MLAVVVQPGARPRPERSWACLGSASDVRQEAWGGRDLANPARVTGGDVRCREACVGSAQVSDVVHVDVVGRWGWLRYHLPSSSLGHPRPRSWKDKGMKAAWQRKSSATYRIYLIYRSPTRQHTDGTSLKSQLSLGMFQRLTVSQSMRVESVPLKSRRRSNQQVQANT